MEDFAFPGDGHGAQVLITVIDLRGTVVESDGDILSHDNGAPLVHVVSLNVIRLSRSTIGTHQGSEERAVWFCCG